MVKSQSPEILVVYGLYFPNISLETETRHTSPEYLVQPTIRSAPVTMTVPAFIAEYFIGFVTVPPIKGLIFSLYTPGQMITSSPGQAKLAASCIVPNGLSFVPLPLFSILEDT